MTTTQATVANVASPAQRRSGAELRDVPNGPGPFGRHLDVAKQQSDPTQHSHGKLAPTEHSDSVDGGSQNTPSLSTSGPPPSAPAARQTPPMSDVANDDSEADEQAAAALAGAMLALLGPVAPARPMSTASAATGSPGANGESSFSNQAITIDVSSTLLQLDKVSANAATATSVMAPVTDGAVDSAATLTAAMIAAADIDEAQHTPVPAVLPGAGAIAAAPTHLLQTSVPVGSQAFTQELGQQIAWLGGQDIKHARIRLHPEELGELDVSVSVAHGRVDVAFQAQHPAAVTALQQSLFQLGQMLAQHGLTLGHAEVGQHRRDPQDPRGGRSSSALAAEDLDAVHVEGPQLSSGLIKLLDAFA